MMRIFLFLGLTFSGAANAALSDSACATSVVNQIKTVNSLSAGAEAQAIQYWTLICKGIFDHIKSSADIQLGAGDIVVPGAGLLDGQGAAVTGQAQNQAATLTGKIK